MSILTIVLLPFIAAVLPILVEPSGRTRSAWAAGAVAVAAFGIVLSYAPAAFDGQVVVERVSWVPSLGLDLAFRIDGLSFLFAFLITGIGILIVLYARYYLSARDSMGRFYAYLLLFMGSMLGVVLSENLLVLVLFWELTSLSSFLLIGYWSHRADARQGALMALVVTGAGGLALLGGVILLGSMVGSYELSDVFAATDTLPDHPLFVPMLLLVLLGAFTKSAQFPFHFWLPQAMAAPTPVSAYLHSATMVKAGIFLLARLFPALSADPLWVAIVASVGLITMVFAAYAAMFQTDTKALLAYSTVSHLGLITMLLGFGTELAAVAGVFHVINHCAFKASLFMAAGIVDHEAGSRDIRKLGGLYRQMPLTAALATVGAAAMAGVPLLNGFLSKEMMFHEALEFAGHSGSLVVPALVTIGAAFSVGYSIYLVYGVFFGPPNTEADKVAHEPPRFMRLAVEVLVVLCIVVGVLPQLVVGGLLETAATATAGGPLPYYSLAIWHGFTWPLAMSGIAILGGLILFTIHRPAWSLYDRLPHLSAVRLYLAAIDGCVWMCRRFTDAVHTGSLQRAAALLVAAALVAGISAFVGNPFALGSAPPTPVDLVTWVAFAVLVLAVVGSAVMHRRRVIALILVGVAGLIVSLIFVHFSAPDLALTQLSVEVVTTILLLLALHLLPKESPVERALPRQVRDIGLAVLAGVGTAGLAWAVMTRPLDSISDYFLAESVPGGGGHNVVNVILVDFRGYDTMGEIIVLGIAAVGIHAMIVGLLAQLHGQSPPGTLPLDRRARDPHPLILVTVTRLLLPLALLVSAYIFLRGHNFPGGGFVAGLITAIAMVMQYMASGIAWTERRLRLDYRAVVAVGVAIAVVSGAGAWLSTTPFLTSDYTYIHLPIVGEFELATAMLFDLGVYVTVLGAVLLMLSDIGQVETQAPRTSLRMWSLTQEAAE